MNLVRVKLTDVVEGNNPRSDFSKVDDIAESIRRFGLLQPMVVEKFNKQYIIIDGACRFRALKKIKQAEADAIVLENPDDKTKVEITISANLMRSDLNLLEKARGLNNLFCTQPSKYNRTNMANMFGMSVALVGRLIKIAQNLPTTADPVLSPHLKDMGIDGVEMISQIPAEHVVKFLNAWEKKREWDDVDDIINQVFDRLDWMDDALNTGQLISSGKAFVINVGKTEIVLTADKSVYTEAKQKYEKANKAQYGSGESRSKKMSEKDKADRKKKQAADKKAREKAIKELPKMIADFLAGDKVDQKWIDEIGRDLCSRFTNAEYCRRLFNMFGIKYKGDSFSMREKSWDLVFKKLCNNPTSIVLLFTYFNMPGFGFEIDWHKNLKKIQNAKNKGVAKK